MAFSRRRQPIHKHVTLRVPLERHYAEALQRAAEDGGIPLEQLAAQLLRRALIERQAAR